MSDENVKLDSRDKPQKVIDVGFSGYQCPTCRRSVRDSRQKYCSNCGQRLDWS